VIVDACAASGIKEVASNSPRSNRTVSSSRQLRRKVCRRLLLHSARATHGNICCRAVDAQAVKSSGMDMPVDIPKLQRQASTQYKAPHRHQKYSTTLSGSAASCAPSSHHMSCSDCC